MLDTLWFFQSNPIAGVGFVFLIGLCIGSFLNVVIHRLPKMMERDWAQQCEAYLAEHNLPAPPQEKAPFNLMVPRSRCPHCGHVISSLENIPVISYVMLRGKCRGCQAHISPRYPIIELVTAALSALVAYRYGFTIEAGLGLIFVWCLISLTMIDFDTYLLPDSITLPLLWLGLVVNYFNVFTSLDNALWGAVIGYLCFWSLFWVFKLLTGKEGMGYGDFKLLAALGAWMGWQMLPQIILVSSLVGAVIGISLIVIRGRDKNIPIPFGPYLAIAGGIAFIWGEAINDYYLQTLFLG
jgi:leader peptidase (prepilin peptidase)/N-methyltransferase